MARYERGQERRGRGRWQDEDRWREEDRARGSDEGWADPERQGYERPRAGGYGGYMGPTPYAGGGMMPFAMVPPWGAGFGTDPYTGGRSRNDWRADQGRRDPHERDFFDKAADEVSSWFGDEAAEHRREEDHRGRGPKGYQRSDARIEEDVHDRLTHDRYVDASEVSVTVKDREVTLDGTVHSRRAKRRAEDCCEEVYGVEHVQNNLRVMRQDLPPTGAI